MKIVRDLGEDALPEPQHSAPAEATSATASTSTDEPKSAVATESQDTVVNTTPESGSASASTSESGDKHVTTQKREPLKIPPTVQVEISSENLKEYVGPAVYHKDRFYTKQPPAGVSTGLGYLGNGSGAVMPVEAMVSASEYTFVPCLTWISIVYAWQGWSPTYRKARRGHSRERADRT